MQEDLVSLEWDESSGVELGRRVLIGKLMTDKALNRNTMMSMISKGWNVSRGLVITELNQNTFLFSFDREDECSRIIKDDHV